MRRCTSDAGFSLTELLVVLALMGLVLAGGWSVLHVVQVSVEQNNEQSWLAQEIGIPLDHAERMFSQQAPPLQQVGPYMCQFRTDQDRDNLYEMHTFQVTSAGRLEEVFYEELPMAGTPTPVTRVWSDDNRNLTSHVPVFTYYDSDDVDISSESAVHIAQEAASVEVTLVAVQDGRRYTDSRRIFFRNR